MHTHQSCLCTESSEQCSRPDHGPQRLLVSYRTPWSLFNRCTSPLVSADSRTGTRKTYFRFCIQTGDYRSPQLFVLNADVSFLLCRTNVCMTIATRTREASFRRRGSESYLTRHVLRRRAAALRRVIDPEPRKSLAFVLPYDPKSSDELVEHQFPPARLRGDPLGRATTSSRAAVRHGRFVDLCRAL
jgi:hypothetical protein